MQFLRKSAVRLRRNLLGKPVRGRLTLQQVLAMETAGIPREEILDLLDRGWMLPLTGATSPINQTVANAVYFPASLIVTTDQTINQGDCTWWDGVNYTLKPATTAAQVAVSATGGFCGVAGGTNTIGVYPDPPSGVSEKLPGIPVQRGGSCTLSLQTNDVIDGPFQNVTLCGVDAQTVTRGLASSSNRVGLVVVHPPATAQAGAGATPVPPTVAGGGRIEVWLEPKYPTTVLL